MEQIETIETLNEDSDIKLFLDSCNLTTDPEIHEKCDVIKKKLSEN
jgi:hypothetical protein